MYFCQTFSKKALNNIIMTEETTFRPSAGHSGQQMMQHEELSLSRETTGNMATQTRARQAEGVACPHCGTVNDAEASYCASCGKPLRVGVCPHCGSELDADADFCEVCHHYVKTDICSFCGTELNIEDGFCPQCGSPRGGIVCPTCNTLNDFAFCKQCGTPLTDEARQLAEQFRQQPEYELLAEKAHMLDELSMEVPYSSERDVVRDQMNEKLRERILTMLAKDKGVAKPEIPPTNKQRLSKEELASRKAELQQQISNILDRIATPAMTSPIKARNYAMAQKPAGVRLAWVCNFKHAMHSSPCGCAKPQLGGKWVILGKGTRQEIKDDK